MLKLYDMKCEHCGERLEELVEYDISTQTITEDVLCPVCGRLMAPTQDNLTVSGKVHSSAGRWNDHNMVG